MQGRLKTSCISFLTTLFISTTLTSCGGGSSTLPPTPQPQGEINLVGEWKTVLTIPECPSTPYHSIYTYTANSDDKTTLQDLTETGVVPDTNNVAACNSITTQTVTLLAPYHVNQRPSQFKEMLSLKLAWQYDGITISEFTNNKIVVDRTVNFNNTGNRIWIYTLSRIPSLIQQSDSINLTGLWNVVITMMGCTNQTYNRTFEFFSANDNTKLDRLITMGIFPGTSTSNRCTNLNQNSGHGLSGYPVVQTAAQFKQMMEPDVWHKVEIIKWTATEISIIRTIVSTIPLETAELRYTIIK